MVNQIMACVTNAQLVVLINGAPSSILSSSKGIRQEFPCSPLLFLLVIEGLSKLIVVAKSEGKIRGIQIYA